MIFEFIQTEFEECTETLSQIIARPYLRTPKHRIVQVTKNVKRKRLEFLETIARGLIPPDTPPSLKKFSRQRWKYLLKDDVDGDDNELKKAIANSLKELDPKVIKKNESRMMYGGLFIFRIRGWWIEKDGILI